MQSVVITIIILRIVLGNVIILMNEFNLLQTNLVFAPSRSRNQGEKRQRKTNVIT